MATTFSERDAALDAIVAAIADSQKTLDQINTLAKNVVADLNALPTTYAGELADIDTEATANPNDEALQNHKAKKALLTSEFTALKNLAQQIDDAITD